MSEGARLASLPMYDDAELRPAAEVWWAGLARHFRDRGLTDVPEALTWPHDLVSHWRTPWLLFSQTCGYPFVNVLGPAVRLVATPCYNAPGCDGPHYAAHVIVREDARARSVADLRGCRLAVNGPDSHSGCQVWRLLLPDGDGLQSFFGKVLVSGSHRASIHRVAAGEADACAVDCVSHALFADHAPEELRGTQILTTSPRAPGLPYVTAAATPDDDIEKVREGLRAALADPSLAPARKELRLSGASVLTDEDYRNAFRD